MKKTLFLYLFFSFNSFSFDLNKKVVILPKDLASIKYEKISEIKDVELTLDFIRFPDGLLINIKKNNQISTLEGFLENLFYIYKEKKKSDLKSLFDDESLKLFNQLETKKVQAQIDVLALISEPKIYSIQSAYGGYIIWWKDKSFRQQRKLFLKRQKNDDFKIASFHASKNDDFFWNSSLYLRFSPFHKFQAKLTKKFNKIKDNEIKELVFELNKAGSYLNIFKKTDTKVNLIAIDNYNYSEYVFKDIDPKNKVIRLKFSGKNFKKQGKHKLYFIESTYPLGTITSELVKEASSFTILKE